MKSRNTAHNNVIYVSTFLEVNATVNALIAICNEITRSKSWTK